MKRMLLAASAATLLAPTLLLAQAKMQDPDKNVSGGVMVKGWMGYVDNPERQKIENAKFYDMGGGFHVTSGPAAVYWSPANMAKGNYSVKATFIQEKAPTHPEAYGLFMSGTKLGTPDQNYLYCIVRGDGKYMVKHRYHNETHTLADWTESAALKKQDGEGKATNEISMWAGKDKVGCSVNGTEVWSMGRADIVGPGKSESVDGIYGIRVNHNLDVHIAGFSMSAMK
jgi:hypothetical protein